MTQLAPYRYLSGNIDRRLNPTTPSPLSIDTPGDKNNIPVENKFEVTLKRERSEKAERERMEEALSEADKEMDIGVTPAGTTADERYRPGTTQNFLQDLNEDEWANTAMPALGSPRNNLELQLGSQPAATGMVLSREKRGRSWVLRIRRYGKISC